MVDKLILIGASTGGPGHLDRIFRALPKGFSVPVVVAQHINEQFLPTLCESLSQASGFKVQMAREREALSAQGYMTHRDVNRFCRVCHRVALDRSIPCGDHAPSVDELFLSAVPLIKEGVKVLAIVLTGIGHDGAEGVYALREAGARTIAESEESAIVYGMPRAALERGGIDQVAAIDEIVKQIEEFGR